MRFQNSKSRKKTYNNNTYITELIERKIFILETKENKNVRSKIIKMHTHTYTHKYTAITVCFPFWIIILKSTRLSKE